MLDSLKRMALNARKLDSDKIIQKVLDNSSIQQDIISLNTQDQLFEKGIRADGTFIGEYSPATIEGTSNFLGKKQKGQRYDHITLNDTGAFYDSFRIKNERTQFTITADAIKEGTDLAQEFGKEIIGLTEESLVEVRGWILPKVQEMVSESLRA